MSTFSPARHPAAIAHSQSAPEERTASGISEGGVRLSIWLDHIDDVLRDLERRLPA